MVIVETRPFQRVRDKCFTEREFVELTYALFRRPELGVVIQGTGGVRKLRWRSGSQGKRSGIRVIYYIEVSNEAIYLLTAYAKKDIANLPHHLLRKMRQLIENGKED